MIHFLGHEIIVDNISRQDAFLIIMGCNAGTAPLPRPLPRRANSVLHAEPTAVSNSAGYVIIQSPSRQHYKNSGIATPTITSFPSPFNTLIMAEFKVAVLDDYQGLSRTQFSKLDSSTYDVTIFNDTLLPYNCADTPQSVKDALVKRLEPFQIICINPAIISKTKS